MVTCGAITSIYRICIYVQDSKNVFPFPVNIHLLHSHPQRAHPRDGHSGTWLQGALFSVWGPGRESTLSLKSSMGLFTKIYQVRHWPFKIMFYPSKEAAPLCSNFLTWRPPWRSGLLLLPGSAAAGPGLSSQRRPDVSPRHWQQSFRLKSKIKLLGTYGFSSTSMFQIYFKTPTHRVEVPKVSAAEMSQELQMVFMYSRRWKITRLTEENEGSWRSYPNMTCF